MTRPANDQAVTPILGTMLMLAMMATMIFPAMQLVEANREVLEAHTEQARQAAWCARHPDIITPACPDNTPMPGYHCTYAKPNYLCTPTDLPANQTIQTIEGSTP